MVAHKETPAQTHLQPKALRKQLHGFVGDSAAVTEPQNLKTLQAPTKVLESIIGELWATTHAQLLSNKASEQATTKTRNSRHQWVVCCELLGMVGVDSHTQHTVAVHGCVKSCYAAPRRSSLIFAVPPHSAIPPHSAALHHATLLTSKSGKRSATHLSVSSVNFPQKFSRSDCSERFRVLPRSGSNVSQLQKKKQQKEISPADTPHSSSRNRESQIR